MRNGKEKRKPFFCGVGKIRGIGIRDDDSTTLGGC